MGQFRILPYFLGGAPNCGKHFSDKYLPPPQKNRTKRPLGENFVLDKAR